MRLSLGKFDVFSGMWPIFALLASLGSCKTNPDASEAKSLDNFARGTQGQITQNSCGSGVDDADKADTDFIDQLLAAPGFLTFEGKASTAKETLTQDVASAMRSVPTVLQIAFARLGGSIVVTSDIQGSDAKGAPRNCSTPAGRFASADQSYVDSEGSVDASGNQQIKSCWREVVRSGDGGADGVRGLVIYVDQSPEAIQHGLVRAFGYAFSQYLVRWDAAGADQAAFLRDAAPEFDAYKEKLTVALLQDVAANTDAGGPFDLTLFRGLLSDSVLKARGGDIAASWAAFKAKGPSVAGDFEDYVFAESFDSYYCSEKTHSVMAGDFKATYGVFGGIAQEIGNLKDALPTYDSVDALKNGGAPTSAGQPPARADGPAGTQGAALGLTGEGGGKDSVAPTTLAAIPVAPAVAAGEHAAIRQPSFALFGGLFAGIGRALGGLARGIGYVGGAVIRGAGAAAVGLVQFTGQVVEGGLRVFGGIVRATGRVGAFLVGGAVRGVVGLARGAGQIAVGAANAVGAVGAWVIGGTGQVIHGLFGPFLYAQSGQALGLADGDYDGDGVPDSRDFCSNTPPHTATHPSGDWTGCGSGQKRDADLARQLYRSGYDPTGDYDLDGIPNDQDKCSNTPKGVAVHPSGDWSGCGTGQRRDSDVLTLLSANSN